MKKTRQGDWPRRVLVAVRLSSSHLKNITQNGNHRHQAPIDMPYYNKQEEKKQPKRIGSARSRINIRGKIERRRVVYNEMPSIEIDLDGKITKETQRISDDLFDQLYLPGRKRQDKRDFWTHLLQTSQKAAWDKGCIRYTRNCNHPDYKAIKIQVIEAAIKAGLFESILSPKGSPKMSRLIPTPELTDQFSADPFSFDLIDEDLVIVRDKVTKKRIEDERPEFKNIREKLHRVNDINDFYRITACIENVWGDIETRQLYPTHYRVFHPGMMHGRIYTGKYGHQSLSKLERSTIKFDGEESCELDYSALHIRMLYHLNGKDYQGDPYELWNETTPELRKIAKQTINAMINAKTNVAAVAACNQAMNPRTETGNFKSGKGLQRATQLYRAIRKTNKSFKEVAELALKTHPIIEKNEGNSEYTIGEHLMTLDGKIAQKILYGFAKKGIPCLGVHDSFIVPKHAEAELKEKMMSAYEEKTDFLPIVK